MGFLLFILKVLQIISVIAVLIMVIFLLKIAMVGKTKEGFLNDLKRSPFEALQWILMVVVWVFLLWNVLGYPENIKNALILIQLLLSMTLCFIAIFNLLTFRKKSKKDEIERLEKLYEILMSERERFINMEVKPEMKDTQKEIIKYYEDFSNEVHDELEKLKRKW